MEKPKQDDLWKEVIDDLFEEFVGFFLPELYKEVDFSKGYTFLEEELRNIFDKVDKNKKYTDRLAKVFLKTGEEVWILLHIEIQGYYDVEFSERMFRYFYRVYDKYNKKIAAIAVFTDENKGYKPKEYEYEYHGTKLKYEYNVYKILEHTEEELLSSDNIFAKVVLTGLYYIRGKLDKEREEEIYYAGKYSLIKMLIRFNYDREKIRRLLVFLDGILFLNDKEYEKRLIEEITRDFGGEGKMALNWTMSNAYIAGREEGIFKTAANLLKMGMDIFLVKKATGLTEENLKEIQKEIDEKK